MASYLKLSSYLKQKYGEPVWKVSVDAGFSCPNLDGFISTAGCIFCNNGSFSMSDRDIDIERQIETGLERMKSRARKFILYFQSFSNTYSDIDTLRARFDIIKKYPEFIILAVGTRPDCINETKADLLAEYRSGYDVWVELGLQSAHDETLKRINRGHTFRQFEDAVNILAAREIDVFVHLILGLPGETIEQTNRTAEIVSGLPVRGVKIHPLHVVKNTVLARDYLSGNYQPLDEDEFIEMAVSFLERLRPDVVIGRLSADVMGDYLLAPEWIRKKSGYLNRIESEMKNRNTTQGAKYKQKL